MITSFGTAAFTKELESFLTNPATGDLKARHRNLPREVVRLPDGMTIELSAGGQNTLIRSIIEEFTPRFVRKPRVLLLGDAADKEVLSNDLALAELGIKLAARGKAPDVLIHDVEREGMAGMASLDFRRGRRASTAGGSWPGWGVRQAGVTPLAGK